MIVSWNWLNDYVALDVEPAEVEQRLMMAGLNHESTESVDDDLAIDLEITSNRPDCLGHIGVAREASVLFGTPLTIPDPTPQETTTTVADLVKVRVDCPELCYRYTARVIRGVKVGPSPAWLVNRLKTIGIASINNVVDVSNYVLMECGQPLHAFDLAKLGGPEIIVREANNGEEFLAIDHKTYTLEPGMCVIADSSRAVALGGVMGGAESEVSDATVDLLIESAEFAPVSIRGTARKLNLYSPSSYRFERGLDPDGVDWASRRCCELILELAGGELAEGVVDVGRERLTREPVTLRLPQVKRVLGIDVSSEEVQRILTALGCDRVRADQDQIEVIAPAWRRDLTREIDLIEEVARIHGYDKIPEDAAVPMCPSHRSNADRVQGKVRQALTAAGFDEALTASVVSEAWTKAFSPWTDAKPLKSYTPTLKGADRLRLSLIPSLLDVRRMNESVSNPIIELFETARIYLPSSDELPVEQPTLGIISGGNYSALKGVVEGLVAALDPAAVIEVRETSQPLFDTDHSCELRVNGERLGVLGELTSAALKSFKLRSPTTVAELSMFALEAIANLIPQYSPQSAFPAMSRDLNLIVDETLRWADLATTVRASGGQLLEEVAYQDVYRDTQRDGAGKKRLLFSITLRSSEATLTNEQADEIRDSIVAACGEQHAAKLLA
ncbi:MAG: phenylalanine--tRNA ligase subunit beta [Planctomycetaceae bacterium]|nr:phenylalanine--tRNA ligase subunit beta [Planctomycetales bacterium]MCB9921535.1 phenylalanine--tRNA ligase subunit beta [Planctomycetaceae bacterium]